MVIDPQGEEFPLKISLARKLNTAAVFYLRFNCEPDQKPSGKNHDLMLKTKKDLTISRQAVNPFAPVKKISMLVIGKADRMIQLSCKFQRKLPPQIDEFPPFCPYF